jgi:iron(III) transport system substrate-binding protein
MEPGMSQASRQRVGILGVAVVGALVAACGTSSGPAGGPTSGGTITLYSGQHEGLTKALVAAFTKQTGTKVQVRNGEDPQLANQLVTEGKASPADVVLTENSPALTLLADKGRLAAVDPATLANVPSRYNSPAGKWVGVAGRETALIYNPKVIPTNQLPASVLDLAQPAWKGKLAIAPEEIDFSPVVTAVNKLKGPDVTKQWLAGFAGNAKRYDDNEGMVAAVESGQVGAAIINHYYWFQAAAEKGGAAKMHSQLHYFGHGDPGALVDVSGAAVLASSKHPALAQKFVSFLVSKEGEQALVDSGDFEYPLGRNVPASPQLKPFNQLDPPNLTPTDLGDGQAAQQLLQQAGLL